MKFSAHQISEILEGTIEGNPDIEVSSVAKIEEGKKGSISFLANPKYTEYIYSTDASIVIVNNDFRAEKPTKSTLTIIRVENAYESFGKLLEMYNQVKNDKIGISKQAAISESASIGESVYIGDFVSIGENVKIGKGVKIYPNTTIGDNAIVEEYTTIFSSCSIYSETQIGRHCIIHAGVRLGADGFGFVPNSENNYNKVAQIGNVIIEDHVEVGANTSIDRATLGSTIIRKGVKLDNLIQIAHNVEIGENTVIAAQSGIAGSTKIGKHCVIGGQVGIVGHITIGDNVRIQAQTGVGRSIKSNEMIQGSPAMPYNDFSKSYIYFKKLPIIVKELDDLKKTINENI